MDNTSMHGDDADDGGQQLRGFHNPLFSTNTAAPKKPSLFPQAGEKGANTSSKLSTLLMKRHGRQDGRKDGATVDITRRRSSEQLARLKKKASSQQLQRMGSIEMPACVVVKSGDASDAGEVLQHCAFRMESYRIHDKECSDTSKSASFRFVFNPGSPSQSVLDVTHLRPPAAKDTATAASRRDSDPRNMGKVRMTLGGMNVPHVAGEPYSCHIRQVGYVTFNPRKQAKGNFLYILSQEQRTLFTSFG